jgi:hypothetical protein
MNGRQEIELDDARAAGDGPAAVDAVAG